MRKHALKMIGLAFLLVICCPLTFAQSNNDQSIKVEAVGILSFQGGRGYFVAAPSKLFRDHHTRIWLRLSEDKVTGPKLDMMLNARVRVRGELEQLPGNVNSSVPPLGLFMQRFEIETVRKSTNN